MQNTIDVLRESLERLWSQFVSRLPYVLAGLIAFLAILVLANLVAALIRRGALRADIHGGLAPLFSRLAKFVGAILGLFTAAVIIFPSFQPGDLMAGLGITSIALGFAFKDILQNFLAGILILWRQPFKVGDEIRAGEHEGVVEEINSRSTRIKTFTGEQAVVPNAEIYTSTILVRTAYEARRVRFVVSIDYGDSIEEAKSVIRRVLESSEGVLKVPDPWVHVVEFAPSGVNLAVYFWVEPHQANLLKVSDRVATGIKLALDEAGIFMPYPHTVVIVDPASRGGLVER